MMITHTRSVLLAACIACAPAPAPGTSTKHGALDVITRAELADPSLAGSTLVDAIRRIRPRFLNERGGGIRGESEVARVSINGADPGPVGDLSRYEPADVQEIRYLSTADAQLRFGIKGTMGPVLLVTTRPR